MSTPQHPPSPARVCVIGTGTMGVQIACLCALSGHVVRLNGRRAQALADAEKTIAGLLRRRVEKGKLSEEGAADVEAAITYTEDLPEAAAEAEFVIESIAEDQDAKHRILNLVTQAAPVTAIIGTNSSTMGSSRFERSVTNPDRLLNIHFFNPPLVMDLVELVRGDHTSDATMEAARAFVLTLGKSPVHVNRETFGFVANRMLFAALAEAMRLVDGGYVTAAECDLAVRNALGWPMGPLAIGDLVGLDVVEAILEEGVRQTGDAHWEPTAQLRDLVGRRALGRKTGSGFFDS
jgi:3-hydroxybutyryl-CoA dehydrogenase